MCTSVPLLNRFQFTLHFYCSYLLKGTSAAAAEGEKWPLRPKSLSIPLSSDDLRDSNWLPYHKASPLVFTDTTEAHSRSHACGCNGFSMACTYTHMRTHTHKYALQAETKACPRAPTEVNDYLSGFWWLWHKKAARLHRGTQNLSLNSTHGRNLHECDRVHFVWHDSSACVWARLVCVCFWAHQRFNQAIVPGSTIEVFCCWYHQNSRNTLLLLWFKTSFLSFSCWHKEQNPHQWLN